MAKKEGQLARVVQFVDDGVGCLVGEPGEGIYTANGARPQLALQIARCFFDLHRQQLARRDDDGAGQVVIGQRCVHLQARRIRHPRPCGREQNPGDLAFLRLGQAPNRKIGDVERQRFQATLGQGAHVVFNLAVESLWR